MSPVIAVTGGTSGIGAAAVARLLAQEAAVYSLDVVPGARPGVSDIHCDLADLSSIEGAMAALPSRLDAIVSVAGIAPGITPPNAVMAVNFLGMREMITRALPRVRDDGAVVIVASSAGRDWRDEPRVIDMLDTADMQAGARWLAGHTFWHEEAYRFSKQCAAAWTYRAAGLERSRRVRVNCVNPGIVETNLSPHFRDMLGRERYDFIVEQSGRAGRPTDVAEVIEYLALGDCGWLNGVELTVDGGYYAGVVGGWAKPWQ